MGVEVDGLGDFTDKIVLHSANYITISNSPKSIKNVFALIKNVKWNEHIQIITCLKWLLLLVKLFLTK